MTMSGDKGFFGMSDDDFLNLGPSSSGSGEGASAPSSASEEDEQNDNQNNEQSQGDNDAANSASATANSSVDSLFGLKEGESDSASSGVEIIDKPDTSIFQIISVRYLKSGMNHLGVLSKAPATATATKGK